jgi:hypothetical protein
MHGPIGKGEQENEHQGTPGCPLPGLVDQVAKSLSEFLLIRGDADEQPRRDRSVPGFAHSRSSSLKGIARIGRDSRTGKLYEKESR